MFKFELGLFVKVNKLSRFGFFFVFNYNLEADLAIFDCLRLYLGLVCLLLQFHGTGLK